MGTTSSLIKPITRLTKAQWKAIVSRVMDREGKAPPNLLRTIADDLHKGEFEPDVVNKVGELMTPTTGGGIRSQRLPIEEARAQYFSNPDKYIPGGYAPQMSQINVAPPPEPPMGVPREMVPDMASEIAMSRVKQVPIVPPRLAGTRKTMEKDYLLQETEQQLSNQGMGLEDIRPGVNPERVLEEKGVKINKQDVLPSVGQLTQAALIADQLWKDMGGGRSIGAKVWELYRKSSRQSSHIANARDYFISSFTRWKDDPNKFTKNYPREAKVLNQLWDTFEQSVTTPPTGPSPAPSFAKESSTVITPRTDVAKPAKEVSRQSLPTFIQEGRFQGNVPFTKNKSGDVRARIEMYIKSFKTREAFDKIVMQDPGFRRHLAKNWDYYKGIIEKLPSGGK